MMRKRGTITSCATTAACFASTMPSTGTAFFLAPPTVTTSAPRGLSLQSTSHGTSSKHPFHPQSTLRYKVAKEGGGNALAGFSRNRPRSHATRTSMVFGGGGGGRGPKTPFGLSSGTLVTIGFALLVFFAPGVVFGAFNTLFLVVTLGPLLFSLGINLYNKVNLTDAPCPVCGVQLQGLKNRENQCPSCGTMLMAQDGKFEALGSGYVRDETGVQQEFTRVGDNGVIDVDAIDVDD